MNILGSVTYHLNKQKSAVCTSTDFWTYLGINKFSPMNDFGSENSVTGVTDVGVTGETEDLATVTTSIPQQDVVLTLPDSSDKIKPQNIEKAVFIFDKQYFPLLSSLPK